MFLKNLFFILSLITWGINFWDKLKVQGSKFYLMNEKMRQEKPYEIGYTISGAVDLAAS